VHERVRYRRTFSVPWRARTLLCFGAVDWRCEVRLDGRSVGGHSGGYTHFRLDLGELEPGREYELVADVEDPADAGQPKGKQRGSDGGIWYARTTGIWQPVWLEPWAEEVAVESSVDGNVDVRGAATARVLLDGRVVAEGEPPLRVEHPRLWHPDDPVLYDVQATTESGAVVTSYTAFRSIERRGREILLNGEPIFLRGVLDQGYWPDGGYTAPDDDALRADVESAKALGFNLARMHVKVADARWYAWCDRLGLLVAQDIPSSHDLSTDEWRENFAREAAEIVAQLRGHPCVVMWILFNEDWGEPPPDFQRRVVRETRAADPSRLVVDASGWKQLDDTDLRDVHDYGDDLSPHVSLPDLPLWVGECGGVSLPARGYMYKSVDSPEELRAERERLVGTLGDVAGFVWTQLADVEEERNGLLRADRVPKL
jgi:beta-galactosidase/beta-glucuronidase